MIVQSSSTCRAAETHAMETFGLEEDVLMERASLGAWKIFRHLFPESRRFAVVCGKGSNGGDGLALARHAANDGICPVVVLVDPQIDPSSACGRQLDLLRKLGIEPVTWQVFRQSEDVSGSGLMPGVDALFGTGLRRALEGEALEAACWLSHRPTLALDLPSGLDGSTGRPLGACVKAVATATFGRAKPGLFLHPGRDFAGEVQVVDLGIPEESWGLAGEPIQLLDQDWATGRVAPRSRGAHKGDAGRGFLLCGSDDYFGAAVLASSAALRSGIGLIHVGSTPFVATRLAQIVPEVMGMVAVGGEASRSIVSKQIEAADALLAGPGLGQSPQALDALKGLFKHLNSPLVLDADGLNLCATHPDLQYELVRVSKSHGAVLTPHPKEAARLMESTVEALLADPLQAAKSIAARFGAVVVFKLATPVIASPQGQVAIGIAGHWGMAVGGCGDALAGAVVARLAEGVSPFEAACQAVRAHARAGDLAGRRGRRGMSVTDLIASLPEAWEEMEQDSLRSGAELTL